MKNVDTAEKYLGFLEEELDPHTIGYIDGFDFSVFMQRLLISEHGYIMDTGNWENANIGRIRIMCAPTVYLTKSRNIRYYGSYFS